MREPFELGGEVIAAGQRRTVDLPVSVLSDHTPVALSAHVVHGRRPGPVMFVSAAVHGDEVIGVEIVRRVLRAGPVARLAGTLIAVPIVNAFGFQNHSRYLPDRRDLNRSFPGTAQGSLAGRLAHLFLTQVVERCDVGIDLHSAAAGRTNLPQIRLTPGNERLVALGAAFGAPVTLGSKLREGSLREAAETRGVDVLLYEAGEGLRLDEMAARAGVAGVLRVMAQLGMLAGKGVPRARRASVLCDSSSWARAPMGGLLRAHRASGDYVEEGTLLGMVSDPFGEQEAEVRAETTGIVIGRTNLPIVNEGDALFHIAVPRRPAGAEAAVQELTDHLEAETLYDEDEII
ncbi:succinylglutamate desuccinylase/aspartoacylase family protein [Aestuariicoccus sp. MJ-SS9]|uniref:succinylglutamate desuccinylase/aspartoacylase family protein n=1 Tax=Aestuariicoccus sp. MJ-SS9 TaxID=3079855 RepID=UPI00290CF452|nr:succinylglutamate desuccinylase/aspartoacylase family protein [Aestuariicoccus sp. MJ-SS9]MDU8909683.1 succinylglutamate desuccinylase/aspartoacylase family protein [Aestuariicoccus sp. MJ-SS9]